MTFHSLPSRVGRKQNSRETFAACQFGAVSANVRSREIIFEFSCPSLSLFPSSHRHGRLVEMHYPTFSLTSVALLSSSLLLPFCSAHLRTAIALTRQRPGKV